MKIVFASLMSVLVVTFFTYKNINIQEKRILCQNETITFEKIFKEDNNKAILLLNNGNYILNSNIEYSKLMKSNLKEKLTISILEKRFESVLKNYIKDNPIYSSDKLIIEYYLYENDKKDARKKNDKAKEYAGYLMYEFKMNKKLVYKIQTDYKNIQGEDLENRMHCVLKSFLSINKL